MIRTVKWTSYTRLSCVGCRAADVVLCIDPTKVAAKLCPIVPSAAPQTTPETSFEWHTIQAQLTNVRQFPGQNKAYYEYTFSYDDVQLVAPVVPLVCGDIEGVFCRGCLTTYIEDLAGNEVYFERVVPEEGAPFLRFYSQHGCQYELAEAGPFFINGDTGSVVQQIDPGDTLLFVGGAGIQAITSNTDTVTLNAQLSADAGNTIVFGGDGGLFSPGLSFAVAANSGTPETIVNGNTLSILGGVSLTSVVTPADTVTVNLDLSADAGQLLAFGTDGNIFLDCATVAACVNPDLGWVAAGSAGLNQQIDPGETLLFQGARGIDTVGINPNIIQIGIFTSGTWGVGDLNFPCASTEGGETYIDGDDDLRVAPPTFMSCVSTAITGTGANPPPLSNLFNNPSLCRTMRISGGYVGAFNYTAFGGPAGGPSLFLNLNGTGENLIGKFFANITAAPGDVPLNGTYVSPDNLDGVSSAAPGGSVTVTIDFRIAAADVGDTLAEFAVSLRACAITI